MLKIYQRPRTKKLARTRQRKRGGEAESNSKSRESMRGARETVRIGRRPEGTFLLDGPESQA